MTAESNYYTLKTSRIKRDEREKRLAYLEQTIRQLHTYHPRTSKKRNAVKDLIKAYTELLQGAYHEIHFSN